MAKQSAFEEYLHRSNLHGVQDVANEKNRVLKSLWTLCFVVSAGFVGLQLYKMIRYYVDDNRGTQIDFYSPQMYPTVLYCPRDWLNITKLANHIEDIGVDMDLYDFAAYLYSLVPFEPAIHEDVGIAGVYQKPEVVANKVSFEHKLGSILSNLGMTIGEFLEDVAFEGENLVNSEYAYINLLLKYTILPVSKKYNSIGVCYQLDPKKYMSDDMSLVEVKYSFMEVWFQMPTAVSKNGSQIEGSIFPDQQEEWSQAIYFGQDAQNQIPANPYPLVPSRTNIVSIQPVQMKRLSVGGRDCDPKADENTKDTCAIKCFQDTMCKKCVPIMSRNDSTPPENACTYIGEFKSNGHCALAFMDGISDCYARCPLPCSTTVYKVSTAVTGKSDWLDYKDKGSIQFPWSVLRIRFRDAQQSVKFEDFPVFTWDNMIANVGGMISLFFGASLLSLVQFLMIICGRACTK